MRSYYVYILASGRNGTLYVGVTNDLIRRVAEHKAGIAEGFTRKHGVHRLVWYGETPDANAAIQREKTMKKWPSRDRRLMRHSRKSTQSAPFPYK